MKIQKIMKVLFVSLTFFLCKTSHAQSELEIGTTYVDLYMSKKFDDIAKEYYSEKSVFEDRTTSFFSEDKSYQVLKGSEQIVSYLKKGFANVKNVTFKIENQYTCGAVHCAKGLIDYDSTFNVKEQPTEMHFSLPLTIMLTIKNGKVIHHLDIADYNKWLEQYRKQSI